MASLTEATKLGDVVKYEPEARVSREKIVLATTLTISLGEVVRRTASGEYTQLVALADEVQTIELTGLAAGVVRLGVTNPNTGDVEWTDELANNASKADIKTELETLDDVASDDIIIGGTDIDAFTMTYSGGIWANKPVALVQVAMGDAATANAHPRIERTTAGGTGETAEVNAVQTVNITGTPTAGDIIVTLEDENGTEQEITTTFDTDLAGTIAAMVVTFDAEFGSGQIVPSGGAWTAILLTFSGDKYSGRAQPLGSTDVSGFTGATAVAHTTTTVGDPGDSADPEKLAIALEAKVTTASTPIVGLVRGPAVVDEQYLNYGAGTKADVKIELKKQGIICRREGEDLSVSRRRVVGG